MKLKSFLKIYFVGLIALLIIVNACSINKRVYRPGYSIEWKTSLKNHSKRGLSSNLLTNKIPQIEISNPLQEPLTASNSTSIAGSKILFLSETSSNTKTTSYGAGQASLDGCDTIVFKNGL